MMASFWLPEELKFDFNQRNFGVKNKVFVMTFLVLITNKKFKILVYRIRELSALDKDFI